MKNKICLFAGTSEGHRLARFLGNQDVQVTISVATPYGAQVIESYENETILHGRMPVEDIISLLDREKFDLVIDATHPYASSITGSISYACSCCHTEYLRLNRGTSDIPGDAQVAADASEAVQFLNSTRGNILLTTGSKELTVYKEILGFSERVYARVLPIASSLESCVRAGLKPSHILAMQGPFSEEMNLACLRSTDAAWMVTKETADEGGFTAKVNACRKAGAGLLVIGRPQDQDGEDFSQVIRTLCSRFGCISRPQVCVIGIGPGSREMMTDRAVQAISEADCLIGAGRMIRAAQENIHMAASKPCFEAVAPGKIEEFIRQNPQYQKISVLMSGDTGFFSGTKKLMTYLDGFDTEVIPGISSLSCLCSRIGLSYEDVFVTSLHGRNVNISALVRRHGKVFVLTGGDHDAASICAELVRTGFGNVRVNIGQRLSYPDEQIIKGTAEELAEGIYDPLCSMILENDRPESTFIPGIPDEMFERGGDHGKIVPMTKSEVRALCISKLGIKHDSVCWDVGAGTGSVSVEMALAAPDGSVYAIEKRQDAVMLLQKNRERFGLDNMFPVSGSAPEALDPLPAPTHVFIGGSSGNAEDIIQAVFHKNSHARIVAAAVTLEAVSDFTKYINSKENIQAQAVQISVSRDTKAGNYHLMTALNPVYLFTITLRESDPADGERTGNI